MQDWRIRSAVVHWLAMAGVACSSSSSQPAGIPGHDAGPPALRTSASCGDLPILGDFAGPHGPISDECQSCVETQCCDAATACAADPGCNAWRECLASKSCAPGLTCGCEPPTDTSLQLNKAVNACRSSCDACLDLACAGQPWPVPPGPSLAIHLAFTSFTSQAPLRGVLVKICGETDHDCTTPVDTQTTGADGTTDLTMPTGPGAFGGYFDFADPSIAHTIAHAHYVSLAADLQSASAPVFTNWSTLDPDTWGLLRGAYNLPKDPGARGRVSVQAISCGGSNLSGVAVTSSNADSQTSFGYVINGVPSTTATQTDSSGIAGWENHPPGPTTLTLTKVSTGQKLLTYDYFARGGIIEIAVLPPGQ